MTKIYIGNLSFNTTEVEIRNLFAQVGQVVTVRIVMDRDTGRSKGFGFVEMQDGGDEVIAQMNGMNFNGQAMMVDKGGVQPARESAWTASRPLTKKAGGKPSR